MRHIPILLVLISSSFLFAQSGTSSSSTVFGDVADVTGAPVASAYVLLHTEGSVDRVLGLDQLGRFSISVAPGSYDIFVSANGFAPFSSHFTVAAGKPTRVDVRLKVAQGGSVVPEAQNKPPAATEYNDSAPAQQTSASSPAPARQEPNVQEYNDAETLSAAPKSADAKSSQSTPAPAAAKATPAAPASSMTEREREARDVAVRFAPVFYQRMAGTEAEHRFELCTVFDFDGDWVGNNNWEHAADPKYPIWAFVYYSVIETEDHYYLHYACYHPRDWSLVQGSYDNVLDVLQQKYEQVVSQGMRKEAEFNHENDLEGVMVIVDKWADQGPAVVAAESVAHNHLLRGVVQGSDFEVPSSVKHQPLPLEDGHPVFYIESQKHGIHPYGGEQSEAEQPIVVLRYGKSTELSQIKDGKATYELVPIRKTFYERAREARQPNLTFGTVVDFGDRFCAVPGSVKPACSIGTIGGALRGDYARVNAAVSPWVWFDLDDPQLPPGSWFFDPASILKRHFGQYDETEKYLYNPYLGIGMGSGIEAATSK